VGDHVTIGSLPSRKLTLIEADIAIFPWVESAGWSGVNVEEFPALKVWFAELGERKAFQTGLRIPEKNKIDAKADPKELERLVKDTSGWVLKGMEEDKKK